MNEPFITGVKIERSEFSNGKYQDSSLLYDVTFEYDGRNPMTIVIRTARDMAEILEGLNIPAHAVTMILQRGGYVARVKP